MNLTESWIHRRPAIVQGRCDVLDGQVRRAGGGIPYRGYAEFEAAVDVLAADPDLQLRLGEQGRHYVETNYQWDVVLDRYQDLLDRAVADFAGRR
jgi:glycosyltransferase involved in cell wall biosynthesis